jgi:L-amino acid N-acyltransferase YncA
MFKRNSAQSKGLGFKLLQQLITALTTRKFHMVMGVIALLNSQSMAYMKNTLFKECFTERGR